MKKMMGGHHLFQYGVRNVLPFSETPENRMVALWGDG
jgi:hypothetical protein